MKFVRFEDSGRALYGLVEGDEVTEIEGDMFGSYDLSGRKRRLSRIKFLPPVCPSKIMAIGLNYRLHIPETDFKEPELPLLFLKGPNSLVGHNDSIILPDHHSNIDHEGELAIIFKDCFKGASREDALIHVFGYTCANDVSHRPIQYSEGGQWARGKSFDTFCPLGPFIVTDLDPSNLKVECRVNGEIRQSSSTSQLIFDVPYLISFLSQGMTFYPGDVLLTGTPEGVSPLKTGDVVEVEIEGIGVLRNPVV